MIWRVRFALSSSVTSAALRRRQLRRRSGRKGSGCCAFKPIERSWRSSLKQANCCARARSETRLLRTFYVVRSGVMAVKARIGGQLPFDRQGLLLLDDALREALSELAHNRYASDEAWTVTVAELAEQLGLPREAVDRLAKAGVLPAPDSEGRLSLWGSVRELVSLAPTERASLSAARRSPRGQPPLVGAA